MAHAIASSTGSVTLLFFAIVLSSVQSPANHDERAALHAESGEQTAESLSADAQPAECLGFAYLSEHGANAGAIVVGRSDRLARGALHVEHGPMMTIARNRVTRQ
jgi:hypothetical protein